MIRTILIFSVMALMPVVTLSAKPKKDIESPHAVIVGPEQVMAGQSAWLKTTGSLGKTFQWQVIPPEQDGSFTELPIFGGMDRQPGPDGELNTADDILNPIVHHWAHFSSTKEGSYYFVLVATEGDKSSLAIHTVIVGDKAPGPDPDPDPDPDPKPTIEVDTPSAVLQLLVKGITPLLTGDKAKEDGVELAKFYLDMANVIERDSTVIKTTTHIRTLNVNAGQLMFQKTGIQGRYTGLSQEIDNVFVAVLTKDNTELTPAKRQELVQALKAIAWACLQ
jgi:hypothetical protein